MDYDFTARLEGELDEIAEGDVQWKKVLNDFYAKFRNQLESAEKPDGGMRAEYSTTETDIRAGSCGRSMQIRTASTGVFLGCSGYSLPPKERCKTTINLTSGDEASAMKMWKTRRSPACCGKAPLCRSATPPWTAT